MGDSRRFRVFADFLQEHFPPDQFPTVADVAGGKGYLGKELRKRGYAEVITIDPRAPRNRFHQSRLFLGGDDPVDVSLVCGLHPDSAAWLVAEYAVVRKKAFATVPCCFLREEVRGGYRGWVRTLAGLVEGTHHWWVSRLPMSGRNIVLWGKARKAGDGDGELRNLRG
jgi:hypothetical protein